MKKIFKIINGVLKLFKCFCRLNEQPVCGSDVIKSSIKKNKSNLKKVKHD